jgi:hypothetical protein
VEDWIKGLIERAIGGIRALARETADKLTQIWRQVTAILTHVGSAWSTYLGGVVFATDGITWVFFAVYNRLRWLVLVRIPAAEQWAINQAVAWARDWIAFARREAAAAVDTLRRWVLAAINVERKFASDVLHWVTDRITGLLGRLANVERRVVDLLTDPARFAGWVFGPLWTLWWRTAEANAMRIAAALFARRRAVERQMLLWVEELVARLL